MCTLMCNMSVYYCFSCSNVKSIASYNPLDRPLIPYFRPLAGMSENSRQQIHVTDDTNIEPE